MFTLLNGDGQCIVYIDLLLFEKVLSMNIYVEGCECTNVDMTYKFIYWHLLLHHVDYVIK